MIDYVVTNTEGYVLGFGSVQEDNLKDVYIPEGASLTPGIKATPGQTKLRLVDGELIDSGLPLIDKTMNMKRREEYPALEDQIGALMKFVATLPGDKPAELIELLSSVDGVKQRHPKPNQSQ
jgi:hypothetical protein